MYRRTMRKEGGDLTANTRCFSFLHGSFFAHVQVNKKGKGGLITDVVLVAKLSLLK